MRHAYHLLDGMWTMAVTFLVVPIAQEKAGTHHPVVIGIFLAGYLMCAYHFWQFATLARPKGESGR